MKTALILISIITYILLGSIMWHKQVKANELAKSKMTEEEFRAIGVTPAALAFLLPPFWLIGAFIRQVFVEDWK